MCNKNTVTALIHSLSQYCIDYTTCTFIVLTQHCSLTRTPYVHNGLTPTNCLIGDCLRDSETMCTIQRKYGIHHHKNCPMILQCDDFNTNKVIENGQQH